MVAGHVLVNASGFSRYISSEPRSRVEPLAGGQVILRPDDSASTYAAAIVETVQHPILLLTHSLRIVTANPAFYTLFHLQPADVEGQSLYDISQGAWRDPEFKRLLEEVLPGSLEVRDYEFEHTFPHIGRRVLAVSARRLQHPDRQVAMVVLALEDRSLQHDASTRTEQARRELARSNRELEEFASIASHDLREPLRKIRAFGERLEVRTRDQLDDTSKDFLARMLNSAVRMSALIDGLLTVARVGGTAFIVQPVPLTSLVSDIVASRTFGADRAQGPTVTVGKLPTVEGDVGQLSQLFENLIDNALKFARPGMRPTIQVFADTVTQSDCTIVVQDNGIGIPPAYRQKIFGMFQRLHSREQYAGTGIGLALCQRIVMRHHGAIHADEAPGGGSRFIVTLPLVQPAPPQEA